MSDAPDTAWPSELVALVAAPDPHAVLVDSRAHGLRLSPGQVIGADALPLHRPTNVGGAELRGIAVELEDPPPAAAS